MVHRGHDVHRWQQVLVCCNVLRLKGGHLRPGPRPSLSFTMGCVLAPKTSPTAWNKTNQVWLTSTMVCRTHVLCWNGQQAVTGGDRGLSRRNRQKFALQRPPSSVAYHMHRAGTCVRLPWVTHGWLIVFGGVCWVWLISQSRSFKPQNP